MQKRNDNDENPTYVRMYRKRLLCQARGGAAAAGTCKPPHRAAPHHLRHSIQVAIIQDSRQKTVGWILSFLCGTLHTLLPTLVWLASPCAHSEEGQDCPQGNDATTIPKTITMAVDLLEL